MPSTKWSRTWFLLLLFLTITATSSAQNALPVAEFSRLIQDLSEEGGYFQSDNFTSSEDSYLMVVEKLKQLGTTGGAYIGVGPEQNFTYIAKIRPQIAFIVDIRRQAMIHHLMYKAIFHHSPSRADFLSLLLSRPMKTEAPKRKAPIEKLVAYFSEIPADPTAYAHNLARILKTVKQDFQFPLTRDDEETLTYIYRNFRIGGFRIGFDGLDVDLIRNIGRHPTLKDLLLQKDPHGNPGNFLASDDDYNFVREMHEKNLIIPVVGDFGGKKALAAVGDYLKKHGYRVSVFYVSNVELVLFEFGPRNIFPDFVQNVKKLPIDDRSLLIRATFTFYILGAQSSGFLTTTSLQNISSFLKKYDTGFYRYYEDLFR